MIVAGVDSEPGMPDARDWPDCPYRIRLAKPAELAQPLAANVLMAFAYGPSRVPPSSDPRYLSIPLPLLYGERAGEIWESRLPLRVESRGAMSLAENGEIMMLRLALPEADLVADTERATERLYAELLRLTAARGYPQLLRIWNFIGNINEGEGDAERYRAFCVGRHRVVSARPQFEGSLPAATAIGTGGGGLTVIVIAGRLPGRQIENPRQLSAYRYPRAYGARSPSFARATLLPWADGAQLLVSGTASIVGHATMHADDPTGQLKQAMLNLQTLVSQPSLGRRGFLPELFTLYMRRREDMLPLLPMLPRYLGGAPVQVLQGDICRRELLLEIEAIYRVPRVTGR